MSIYRGFEVVETAVTEIDTVIILLSRAQSCVKCTHVVATLTVKLTEKRSHSYTFPSPVNVAILKKFSKPGGSRGL